MAQTDTIQVYDQQLQRIAFLQNASNIGYELNINSLWYASFSLPADDPKNNHCQPFNFVEIYDNKKRVEIFRIIGEDLTRSTNAIIFYECEHVLATLLDDVLFQYHQIGNIGVHTSQVIRYVIDRQTTQNWRLGQCDFSRQFEYKWENENLLSALFSIPKPFNESYIWGFDTTAYPWVLTLKRTSDEPKSEIRYGKNMEQIIKNKDSKNLITRLYCLGYGEGDNQLDIRAVNGGIPYLDAPTITTWGLRASILADRRFEDAESLKAYGQQILNAAQDPYVSYMVGAVDLFRLTGQRYDEFVVGDAVRIIDDVDGINDIFPIVGISKRDVTGSPGNVRITIANKPRDLAGSITDLQNRALINDLYAQGATNQVMVTFADNADKDNPALMKIYIPESMVRINSCVLNFQFEPFRAHTRGIASTQSTVQTASTTNTSTFTSSAAAQDTFTTTSTSQQTPTSSSTQTQSQAASTTNSETHSSSTRLAETPTSSTQASQTPSTSTQNQQNATSASGGGATSGSSSITTTSVAAEVISRWRLFAGSVPDAMNSSGTPPHIHMFTAAPIVPAHSHGMSHTHSVPAHTHNVTIPGHSHTVTIPGHSHSVPIPSHSHTVTIPGHSHTVPIPGHSHSVTIPGHSHSVTIPSHSHTVEIRGHTHSVDIPAHKHDVEYGIFKTGGANEGRLFINGKYIQDVLPNTNINIASVLADDKGMIPRNTFHTVEIYPSATNNNAQGLTRIVANIFLQIFTNSRGSGDF